MIFGPSCFESVLFGDCPILTPSYLVIVLFRDLFRDVYFALKYVNIWKPYQLKTIYSDFLTNWTDTLICFFYVTHFAFLTIAKFKSLSDGKATHWTLYIIQIVYEISLTSSVLGTDFIYHKICANFRVGNFEIYI